jgi:hypothetical protein
MIIASINATSVSGQRLNFDYQSIDALFKDARKAINSPQGTFKGQQIKRGAVLTFVHPAVAKTGANMSVYSREFEQLAKDIAKSAFKNLVRRNLHARRFQIGLKIVKTNRNNKGATDEETGYVMSSKGYIYDYDIDKGKLVMPKPTITNSRAMIDAVRRLYKHTRLGNTLTVSDWRIVGVVIAMAV